MHDRESMLYKSIVGFPVKLENDNFLSPLFRLLLLNPDLNISNTGRTGETAVLLD